jgi:hypothetical protein
MRKSTRIVLNATALGLLALSLVLVGTVRPPVAEASSHREAPMILSDPRADNTDVYAFVSPDRPDTVTLIANWIPFEEPSEGPDFYNFDPTVLYEIKIDNSGDGVEDLSLQFRFTSQVLDPNTILYNKGPIGSLTDPNFNYRQFANVTALVRQGTGFSTFNLGSNLPLPPVNIGPRSTPNYDALASSAISTIPSGAGNIQFFAGQRDEGFYIDTGSAFDLLGLRPFNSAHLIPRATAPGVDFTAGYNVHSVAIQVPMSLLTRTGGVPTSSTDPAAVLGVWATASRQTTKVLNAGTGGSGVGGQTGGTGGNTISGNFVQVSRLANPLVNELLIPRGTTQPGVVPGTKDKFNASSPKDDSQFASFFQDPEPSRLIHLLYPSVNVPPAPRNDVVEIFGTGIKAGDVPGAPNYTTFLSDGQPHEMMRLNIAIPPTATPSRLGLLGGDMAGFPNGRRVGDDVVDIELRVLAGGTPFTPSFNISPNNILGDGVNQNDRPFLTTFPYLASPVSGYDNPFHGLPGSTDTTAPGTGSPSATPTPRP